MTRFTTAAGYDKAEGTAAVLNAVHLWRVRYPVADIGSGNCVFDAPSVSSQSVCVDVVQLSATGAPPPPQIGGGGSTGGGGCAVAGATGAALPAWPLALVLGLVLRRRALLRMVCRIDR